MAQTTYSGDTDGRNGTTVTRGTGALTAASGGVGIAINTDETLDPITLRKHIRNVLEVITDDLSSADDNTDLPTSGSTTK